MAFSNDEKQEIKDIVLETMTEQSDAVDYTEQVVEFAPGDEVPIVRNGDGTGEKSYGRAPVSMFGGGGSSGVNGIKVGGSGQVITPTSGVVTLPAYESGAEKNPAKYLKEAAISQDGNSLTIKDNNNETKTFTPSGGGGGGGNTADVNYDATNKKITKTIDGVTSDVVTVATLKTDMNLGNVGNFKAVSTVANQGLSNTEKSNARTNIGAGTSSFSGSYNDLTNKPTIPCADKSYEPLAHSGLGRKNLEMNNGSNILTQQDFNLQNTIYVIQYDFDLNGQEIAVPAGSVLEFNGGSLNNGSVISNNTVITGTFESSSNCLFGIFYDTNKNALGWDKNKIADWKLSLLYGNFIGSVDSKVDFENAQSMVMDENYIYCNFIKKNGNVANIVVVAIYDRNYNYIGYSRLDRPGHANDATLYNNKLYIACTSGAEDNDSIHVVDIPQLLSNAESNKEVPFADSVVTPVTPIRLGFNVTSIDYDSVTNTFCLLNFDTVKFSIYDTNFNKIKELSIVDYTSILFEKYGRISTRQSLVYKNGIIHCIDFDYNYFGSDDSPANSALIYTIDVATEHVVDVQPITYSFSLAEVEGCCKDPVTGNICFITQHWGDTKFFTIHELTYNNVSAVGSNRNKVNNRSWISSETSSIYIDNSYRGYSCGSVLYPYKTLGEAFVMAGSFTNSPLFRLKYNNTPYFIQKVTKRNTTINISNWSLGPNGERPKICGGFVFHDSKVEISSIDFIPNITATSSQFLLQFTGCRCWIATCNFTIDANSTYEKNIGLYHNSYIFVRNVAFTNERTGNNDHITCAGANNTVIIDSATANDGNLVFLGSVSDTDGTNNRMFIHQMNSVVLNNTALLVRNLFADGSLCKFAESIDTVAKLEKIMSFFESADGTRRLEQRSVCFFVSTTLGLDNGSKHVRDGYYTNWIYNGTIQIKSLDNFEYPDGISAATEEGMPVNGNVYGRSIFNMTSLLPAWWNGTRWIYPNDMIDVSLLYGNLNLLHKSHKMNVYDTSAQASDIDTGKWFKSEGTTGTISQVSIADVNHTEIKNGLVFSNDDNSKICGIQTLISAIPVGDKVEYIVSMYVKGHGNLSTSLQISNTSTNVETIEVNSNDFTRVYMRLNTKNINYGGNGHIGLHIVSSGEGAVTLYGVQLEAGKVMSDWKPNPTDFPLSGTSSDRPADVVVGFQFFDTSLSPARPIYWNGTDWVDATGAAVYGLNEFRFNVGTKYTQTADTQKIGFAFHSFSTTFEIKVIGSGSFSYRFNNTGSYSSYVTSVTVPVGTTHINMLMSYGTYDVSVLGKSYIRNINYIDASANCYKNIFFDISQLNYSEIQNLWISGMPATGLFEPKIKSSLIELSTNTFNANSAKNPAKFDYGINLDSLAGAPNLQSVLARDTDTIGSIESLGSCPQFEYLSVAFSSVTGEVTELAKKQVQNGRTSGNIRLSLIPTNATLNGNAITYESIGNHWDIYIVFDPNETEGYRIQYTAP